MMLGYKDCQKVLEMLLTKSTSDSLYEQAEQFIIAKTMLCWRVSRCER